MRALCIATVVALVHVGCDGSGPSGTDAGGIDDAGPCASDDDCDDELFCTGLETCDSADPSADARGCVAGADPCAVGEDCDEARGCRADCPDEDGDGRTAIACGGDDCDDTDPRRFPGNVEICDADDVDEDCDPRTFGVRDADSDAHPDALCCNVAEDGSRSCGDDCNDARPDIYAGRVEICDGSDNDCDGSTDEGAALAFYPDMDRDGFGDASAAPVMACEPPPDHVTNADDCDDDNPSAHAPSDPEICDSRDNDCDDAVDEDTSVVPWYVDMDMDGFGDRDDASPVSSCAPIVGRVTNRTDCDDADGSVHPLATEICSHSSPRSDDVAEGEICQLLRLSIVRLDVAQDVVE